MVMVMEALRRKNKEEKKDVERGMAEMEEDVMRRIKECKESKVESFHPKPKTSE